MHTSVNVVLPAAPNMRCWVNSLASLYWVRLSLLSSSLFSVMFWASDVAIVFSRSRLTLCSEVVTTIQCRLTCSHNGEPNLLRVSDLITVQLFCLCKIAQSLIQGIKRDTSEGMLPPAQMKVVYEKGQVSHMYALQPPYYDTACLDQKKGTRPFHYVLYIPSAIQASTHMSIHLAPWLGGSTAPPSPPTAGPVGKGQKVCPTREESCSDMRRKGGSVVNSQRLYTKS